ncbi:GNAT family N-acetyltransferase [Skermanella rosea]|uniref:GNAT family N-acetyltransferase n=1 Tax=Skermanella rosea TaxID=1817965 RepID=UPI001931AA52|nr:GNAT family N-acetyltransferase [Skermanella rosea]UEM01979.1 GNAT family N-acetyltransferase [Skermanella rosea]
MPDGNDSITVKVIPGIGAVDAAAWDACAGAENPFLSHAFLGALEDSGSCRAVTGWQPQHLVLESPEGGVWGAVPLYLKSHSYGEYVFDHAWANAYERAGGSYYPKLQAAVPFTPVTGPRLLVHPEAPAGVAPALISAMEQLGLRHAVSSIHVTFPTESDWNRFGEAGWLQRIGQQYHWENRGYGSFDDFLGELNSRKRKSIRKERREVAETGVKIHTLTGPDLRQEHWDVFYKFYMDTSDRKWGSAYLNRKFFRQLGETMADRVVLILVEDDGDWVAGALNLLGSDTLYGRNWGCLATYKHLHFEACYYRAIDFAIERGLKRVEAGAQGQHKIQRGYLPTPTYSAHWIRDPGFRAAVADYLRRERPAVESEIAILMQDSPFRQENSCG